jgi:hypothetical protein
MISENGEAGERKLRPEDFHPFSIYLAEHIQTVYAVNMLLFSRDIFGRAEVIKQFETVAAMHKSGEARDIEAAKTKLEGVLMNSLVDIVRVGICFENYFKVKLMLADVLIHAIDQNKDKALSKKQRGGPVYVTEVVQGRPATDEPGAAKMLAQLEGVLKKQTINYSTILEVQGYVDLLGVPADTIKFLRTQNEARNELHMVAGQGFYFSDEILGQYEKLMRMVVGDMARLHNSLLDKITPDSRSKVPVLC